MKRIVAAALTALLIGIVLWLGRNRSDSPGNGGAATPDECIEQMFLAAEQGDVDAYLACFTGAERERLEQQLIGEPRDAFGRSLSEAVAALKGRAVFQDAPQNDDAAEANFTVDRIYESRTERQRYHLVRRRTSWFIDTVRNATAFQPAKPYGTPVFE